MANLFKEGFKNIDEEKASDSLTVEGEIPDWLRGSYITNGPAIFDLQSYSFNHWFDGLAMLTAFTFSQNAVSYISRFVKSDDYAHYKMTGGVGSPTFATTGHKKSLDRVLNAGGGKGGDNSNVNLARIGERFFALDESAPMMEFEPRTLETKRKIGDRTPIEGQVTTAHPIYDTMTGETVNYVLHFGTRTAYNIFSFDKDVDRTRMIASVPVREPSYMHSFAMTSGHVILTQNPLVTNPIGFLASTKAFIDHYEWNPDLMTRFTVVPREGGEAVSEDADPFFCYHHANAFEKDGAINCDLLRYPDAIIVSALRLDNLRSERPQDLHVGKLRRYDIPLDQDRPVRSTELSADGLEFPRIDPRRSMKEYRFVYGVGQTAKDGTDFLDQLIKVDISDGTVKRWKCDSCYPGEPVFVPNPLGDKEDDGAVLSIILDAKRRSSFLLLLDAASFKEMARMEAPQMIPFKFHGDFYRVF